MSKNPLILYFCALLAACGGGGGGGGASPGISITIDGPTTVDSFGDCNGASWSECVRLSATVDSFGGARADSARWDFKDYRPGFSQECVNYSITNGELIVPAYCSSSGYWCDYGFIVDWFDGNNTRQTQKRHRVAFGALQCNTGSGVVFNGERVANATVFLDSNDNLALDDGEIVTTSNFYGDFKLPQHLPHYTVVAVGGTGIDSGNDYQDSVLVAHVRGLQRLWVTPITTVQAFAAAQNKIGDWFISRNVQPPNGPHPSDEFITMNSKIFQRVNQVAANDLSQSIAEVNRQVESEIWAGQITGP